jgi:hypothetical protein
MLGAACCPVPAGLGAWVPDAPAALPSTPLHPPWPAPQEFIDQCTALQQERDQLALLAGELQQQLEALLQEHAAAADALHAAGGPEALDQLQLLRAANASLEEERDSLSRQLLQMEEVLSDGLLGSRRSRASAGAAAAALEQGQGQEQQASPSLRNMPVSPFANGGGLTISLPGEAGAGRSAAGSPRSGSPRAAQQQQQQQQQQLSRQPSHASQAQLQRMRSARELLSSNLQGLEAAYSALTEALAPAAAAAAAAPAAQQAPAAIQLPSSPRRQQQAGRQQAAPAEAVSQLGAQLQAFRQAVGEASQHMGVLESGLAEAAQQGQSFEFGQAGIPAGPSSTPAIGRGRAGVSVQRRSTAHDPGSTPAAPGSAGPAASGTDSSGESPDSGGQQQPGAAAPAAAAADAAAMAASTAVLVRKLREQKGRADKWKGRCRQLAEQFGALSGQLQEARAAGSLEVGRCWCRGRCR